MAATKPSTITGAWSYSRISTWEQCPLKAKFKYIDGLKEPGSPQMDRGTALHKIAEDYVTMASNELRVGDNSLHIFKRQFDVLRSKKAQCEIEWGFTNTWEATGFFAKNAWVRMKTDVSFQSSPKTRTVVDHKSGNIYEEHKHQLHLYAVGEFVMHPEARTVIAQDWYLDQDAMVESVFDREELGMMKQYWEDRVQPMFEDTIFPARASYKCRYCAFRRSAGGPCQF